MEQLLIELFEKAKTNKSVLRSLKMTCVKAQLFELGAYLRDIENNNFPETEEQKEAKGKAKELKDAFRMVELNIDESVCWLLAETIKMSNKKRGNFSVNDAVDIMAKKQRLFELES